MRNAVMTFRLFEQILKKKLVAYLFRGKEGPVLIFLWVLVFGALTVFFGLPTPAFLWTAACMGFAGLLFYTYLKTPAVLKQLIRSVSKEYFASENISRPDLKEDA